MNCSATKKNGDPCQGTAKKDGLCIAHIPREPKVVVEPDAPQVESTAGKPAFLKGVRRARAVRFGQRRIKMLRPICSNKEKTGCQDGAEVPRDWYLSCPHDPYVGRKQHMVEVPIYSEPAEDGTVTLEEVQQRLKWEVWPNFVQPVLSVMVNSGRGVEKGRAKGYIMPEELRSPAFPNGIAPFCQFRNCFWQHGLTEYKSGIYCSEMEAKRVALNGHANDDKNSPAYGAIEVMHQGKMDAQMDRVVV